MIAKTLLKRNVRNAVGVVLGQLLLIFFATCLLAAILLPALTSE
jgi:hypothetical protein